LKVVRFTGSKPEHPIADLAERILREEAPGVLNFALDGLDQLRADGWQLRLNGRQQRIVDDLLLESDGHAVFVRECLVKVIAATSQLTVPDCFAAYVEFCGQRGWNALTKNRFGALIGDVVVREFGLSLRHDILDTKGKLQRGWKGLLLTENFPQPTDKMASEASESQPGAASSDTTDTISIVNLAKNPAEALALIL
jgi:phage/plasmid-associated DNA primase